MGRMGGMGVGELESPRLIAAARRSGVALAGDFLSRDLAMPVDANRRRRFRCAEARLSVARDLN